MSFSGTSARRSGFALPSRSDMTRSCGGSSPTWARLRWGWRSRRRAAALRSWTWCSSRRRRGRHWPRCPSPSTPSRRGRWRAHDVPCGAGQPGHRDPGHQYLRRRAHQHRLLQRRADQRQVSARRRERRLVGPAPKSQALSSTRIVSPRAPRHTAGPWRSSTASSPSMSSGCRGRATPARRRWRPGSGKPPPRARASARGHVPAPGTRVGCVSPRPRLAGCVRHEPQTATVAGWGAWAPSPV